MRFSSKFWKGYWFEICLKRSWNYSSIEETVFALHYIANARIFWRHCTNLSFVPQFHYIRGVHLLFFSNVKTENQMKQVHWKIPIISNVWFQVHSIFWLCKLVSLVFCRGFLNRRYVHLRWRLMNLAVDSWCSNLLSNCSFLQSKGGYFLRCTIESE